MVTFSVIIPTYNRAADLDRCLAFLVSQTYKDFEVIVCDDGSTDNSKEIVESYKNRLNLTYQWQENWGGPARPRNIGIKLAKAEWICFLDSDDWWYPNKLEECIKHLDVSDIIYHDLDIYNNAQKPPISRSRSRLVQGDIFGDLLINNNAISNSSVVVRKTILEQVGGMSERKDLISVEDWDCWLKIAKITKRFTYIPLALGAYWLGQNISRSVRHVEKLEALVLAHIGSLKSQKEKNFVKKILKYNQARIYQMNGYYIKAILFYLQSSLFVLIKKLFKFLSGFIKTKLLHHYEQ